MKTNNQQISRADTPSHKKFKGHTARSRVFAAIQNPALEGYGNKKRHHHDPQTLRGTKPAQQEDPLARESG